MRSIAFYLGLVLVGCGASKPQELPTSNHNFVQSKASAPSLPVTAPTPTVARPEIVSASEWGSAPEPLPDSRKHTPKFITIHHAGTLWKGGDAAKYVKRMQSWGQDAKGWPDLPYHFLIAPDGQIFEGRPLAYEPDSNTKYELQGNIGVEMMGNFEEQRPSHEQLMSCVMLVAWLTNELQINPENIRGHNDAAPKQTVCPGKDFYRYLEDGQFKKWVGEAVVGEVPSIRPGPPLTGGPTTRIGEEESHKKKKPR